MRQIRIIDFFWVCHDKNREINGLSHLRRNRHPRLGDGLQGRLLGRLARCLAGSSVRNGPSDSARSLDNHAAGCGFCSFDGSSVSNPGRNCQGSWLCCRLRCLLRRSDSYSAGSGAGRDPSCLFRCLTDCPAGCSSSCAAGCCAGSQSSSLSADLARSSGAGGIPRPDPARVAQSPDGDPVRSTWGNAGR